MVKLNQAMKLRQQYSQSRWLIASGGASLFWYISLFPGRIGSDPIQAIILMRNGKSTDWWTSAYFWILRLTTFNGQTIWMASLLSLLVLYFSMIYFLYSLPESKKQIEKIAFLICLSPLFGNFAVNVNHDVFMTAGILLLLGYSFRFYFNLATKIDKIIPYLAIFLLMNGKTGYFIIFGFLTFYILNKRYFLKTLSFLGTAFALFFISSFGITKTPIPMHFLPALADIKCVAQHPDANLSKVQWDYLVSISSLENWKKPITCSSMDIAIVEIESDEIESLNAKEFIKKYISIAVQNPAIVIQAHLQRSSVALPPPFFQGPENQVDRNINNPVGLNTNRALQLGPMVLHPSIDDENLKIHNSTLKILESIALLPSFLINQASWFWGWGGLWLWPIYFYLIIGLGQRSMKRIVGITYPIIVTHIFLFAAGPIPAPRYVMATILIGNVTTLLLFSNLISRTKQRSEVQ